MADEKKPYDHTQAERTFVRGIEGQYNLTQELDRLRSLPRVRKGSETPFHGYPQFFNKDYLIPAHGLGQTLHVHLEDRIHDLRRDAATGQGGLHNIGFAAQTDEINHATSLPSTPKRS